MSMINSIPIGLLKFSTEVDGANAFVTVTQTPLNLLVPTLPGGVTHKIEFMVQGITNNNALKKLLLQSVTFNIFLQEDGKNFFPLKSDAELDGILVTATDCTCRLWNYPQQLFRWTMTAVEAESTLGNPSSTGDDSDA